MNVLMSAFDIFVSTSRGEGFGLTLAEAAASGCPIVAQNVSAIPEVVGPGGILLEPKDTFTVPSGEDVWLPDIPAFTDAIERLYHSKGLRRDLGTAGVEHVRKSFSWDAAARAFDKYITELEHFEPPVPSTEVSEASA
jgi:glycosyltransferase involved in cell wall biosynthesis